MKRSVAVAGDNIGAGKFRNILIAPGGGRDIRKLLHAVHHADGDHTGPQSGAAAAQCHIGNGDRTGEPTVGNEAQLTHGISSISIAVSAGGIRRIGANVQNTGSGGRQLQQLDAAKAEASGGCHCGIHGVCREVHGGTLGGHTVNLRHRRSRHADQDGRGNSCAVAAVSGKGEGCAVIAAAGDVGQLGEVIFRCRGGTVGENHTARHRSGELRPRRAVLAGIVIVVV